MVKPGGTGNPRFAISASPAPLPPRRSRMAAVPSARPSPKPETHLPLDFAAADFVFCLEALGREALGRDAFGCFLRFTVVRARFLAIGQATLVGRRHLKAPPEGSAQARNSISGKAPDRAGR